MGWGRWLWAAGIVVFGLVVLETTNPEYVTPMVLLILLSVLVLRPGFGTQLAALAKSVGAPLGSH